MSNTFARHLGNLSVNLKLGIGFGLVLLLTLLIAATGWFGLSRLIERADKITSISILDDRMRVLVPTPSTACSTSSTQNW